MSTVLQSPSLSTNRWNERLNRVQESANEAPKRASEESPLPIRWQSLSILGGCGLLLWGGQRGSWSGLALAAVGGLLVYRGLSRSKPQETFQESSSAIESPAASQELLDTNADPFPPAKEPQLPMAVEEKAATNVPIVEVPAVVTVTIFQDGELTPVEHALARTTAYYFALERGSGNLPHYEHERAVEDFCRAAAQILSLRIH